MIKSLKIIVFALLLFLFSGPQLVQAATFDYTPSITISKQKAIDSANATQQVLAPEAGVQFTIQRVTVTEKSGHTLDLADTATYTVSAYQGSQPVNLTLITDEKGQASVAGSDQLPRGFYRITEKGTTAQPFIVQLPYKVAGVLKDDLTIAPKSSLVPNGEAAKPVKPAATATKESGKTVTSQIKTKQATKATPLAKIMQTGGAVMALPLVAIGLILLGLLLALFCLMVLWKRRKDQQEDNE